MYEYGMCAYIMYSCEMNANNMHAYSMYSYEMDAYVNVRR